MRPMLANVALGAAAAALVLAGPVQAGERGSWSVVGVAPGDRLNMREHPSAEAAIVGVIPRHGRHLRGFGCEVTPQGQEWCRIKYGPTVGWVNRKFLRREIAAWEFRSGL